MAAETNAGGWILHSHGQGRKFGPLNEDELRNYFRAGMVKSVDRLGRSGDQALLAAADVAAMLGEPAPVGPPPPEPSDPATPPPPPPLPLRPAPAAPAELGGTSEERAVRAAAAMNIDLSTLLANQAPARKRARWILPVVVVLLLVALMMVALNMLRGMKPAAPAGNSPAGSASAGASPAPAAAAPDRAAQDAQFPAQMEKAEVLAKARDWAGLEAFANAWSAADPERNEPLHYLAIAYSSRGDFAHAEVPLKKILGRAPLYPGARALLADTYMQGHRYDQAAAMYKAMVNDSPDEARMWNNYGAALSASGQSAQAVAAVENAVRLDPAFKQAWTNLGNLYQGAGDQAKAAAAFARAR